MDDPDRTLDGIRDIVSAVKAGEHPESALRYLDNLTQLFAGLDAWLSRGGYLPNAWQEKHAHPYAS